MCAAIRRSLNPESPEWMANINSLASGLSAALAMPQHGWQVPPSHTATMHLPHLLIVGVAPPYTVPETRSASSLALSARTPRGRHAPISVVSLPTRPRALPKALVCSKYNPHGKLQCHATVPAEHPTTPRHFKPTPTRRPMIHSHRNTPHRTTTHHNTGSKHLLHFCHHCRSRRNVPHLRKQLCRTTTPGQQPCRSHCRRCRRRCRHRQCLGMRAVSPPPPPTPPAGGGQAVRRHQGGEDSGQTGGAATAQYSNCWDMH
mgnify:CR=1 FL=1